MKPTPLPQPNWTRVNIGYVPEPDGAITVFSKDNGTGIFGDIKEEIFMQEFPKKNAPGLFPAREILEIPEMFIRETEFFGTVSGSRSLFREGHAGLPGDNPCPKRTAPCSASALRCPPVPAMEKKVIFRIFFRTVF